MSVHHEYVPMRRRRDDMRGFSEAQLKQRLERQGWTVWRGELIALTRQLQNLESNQHSFHVSRRRLAIWLASATSQSLSLEAAQDAGEPPIRAGGSTQTFEERECERAATQRELGANPDERAALQEEDELEYRSVLDFPNVRRKYELLLTLLQEDYPEHLETLQYLCAVHHGIPDYLCYRNKGGKREWKFVECKLIYEQLLPGQKLCIPKLQAMGFAVEVQKLVDHRTKTRSADVDLHDGSKRVKEKQMKLPRRTRKRKL
jgi:hypothetical protein